MTRIPAMDFQPLLEATQLYWRKRLEEFFERRHFILGEGVAAFELEFAAAVGASAVIGVGNGTDAITLCLRDAGVTRDVIAPALTAPFTGTAVVAAGCRLRLADVDPETLLLDPVDVENRATKRTQAILPVHLYGQPCDLVRFRALARSLDAVLVQDACQAHGARHHGKPLTSYSPYVAYSFYPTKNLGALGDAGAVATSSAAVDRRLRMLRDGGRRSAQVAHVRGVNSRLDEIQTCFLRAFLPYLDEWNAHRARIAALYDEMLMDCPGVRRVKTSVESAHHLYVIRAARRDKLRESLERHGIGTGVHYPVPLHRMPAFAGCGPKLGGLPHAERACREVVSLPLWPYMPESAASEVAERVRAFYR